jgi:hypothetical protein
MVCVVLLMFLCLSFSVMCGPGSSVSIVTGYRLDGPGIESSEILRTRPDRPWGPPSLLYIGYRVFLGIKRPGRGADHPPPSSTEVENK